MIYLYKCFNCFKSLPDPESNCLSHINQSEDLSQIPKYKRKRDSKLIDEGNEGK